MLLTQYEIDGRWSSVDFSNDFVEQIESETDATLSIIGQSVEGKNIYALTIGIGDRKVLATSGVHGTERASREAFLIKTRDICYNNEGKYTEFLNKHTVVLIPTVNPDRMHRSYRNADNIDINRVIYHLDSPEGVAFLELVRDFDPSVFLDFHEHSGNVTTDMLYVRAMYMDPNSDNYAKQVQMEIVDYLKGRLENNNYTTDYYFDSNTGFGSLTSGLGILGKLAFTAETRTTEEDIDIRINAQMLSFDESLNWIFNNWQKIELMNTGFTDNLPSERDAFILLQGMTPGAEMYAQAQHELIRLPYGYKPLEDFTKFINVYGLELDAEGVIPVHQKSGRMLPHLLDPRADTKVINAEMIFKGEEKRSGGRYTKVMYDDWKEVFIKYL